MPWKVNITRSLSKKQTSLSTLLTPHMLLVFRWRWTRMGGNHYVRLTEGHLWVFWSWANDLCKRFWPGPSPPIRNRGWGRKNGMWTRLCCSTSNPTISPVLTLMHLLSTSFQGEKHKGMQGLRLSVMTGTEKRVSWLWKLYLICKPTVTLHILIITVYCITLIWCLCFCKIIYSAKMVLLFFQSLCTLSLCWGLLYPFSRVICKIKHASFPSCVDSWQ